MFGFIHGRAYDPELGRFLSVDPFITFPDNGQSLNPYSYVMNNPLKYTDPSGYTAEKAKPRLTLKERNKLKADGFSSARVVENDDGSRTVTAQKSTGNGYQEVSFSSSGQDGASAGTPTAPQRGGGNKGGGTPQEQIKQSAHDSIVAGAKASGGDDGLLTAKYGSITRDDDGNITNVGIICGRVCKMEGADYGRIKADQIARGIMRMNYLSSQTQLYDKLKWGGLYYGGLAAQELKAVWAAVPSDAKFALYMSAAEFLTQGDNAKMRGTKVQDSIKSQENKKQAKIKRKMRFKGFTFFF
ncbi:MAG: hypothetical protein HRT35_36720 [Algicola sp.]|nr:hypothetical protein [Algicola sp.]